MRFERISKVKLVAATLLFSAGGLFVGPASAALLAPGGSTAPSPTGSPAGAVNLTPGATPQAFLAADGTSFSGTLLSDVYTNDAGNPFGPSALTFTFVLKDNGPDPLEQLSTINYAGYLTDVADSVTAPLGPIPSSVTRSASGKIIGWQFDVTGPSSLPAGSTSATLVIHTNATNFQQVIDSVIDGSVGSVPSFGPTAVPEPASVGLLSLAGVALMGRRRAK